MTFCSPPSVQVITLAIDLLGRCERKIICEVEFEAEIIVDLEVDVEG